MEFFAGGEKVSIETDFFRNIIKIYRKNKSESL